MGRSKLLFEELFQNNGNENPNYELIEYKVYTKTNNKNNIDEFVKECYVINNKFDCIIKKNYDKLSEYSKQCSSKHRRL